ncbi:MAG: PH domain-containing protein [Gemmatimonadota bacterium]
MLERFRLWILGLLRVPTEPPRLGESRELQVFRASPNYYRYRVVLWSLGQVAVLVGILLATYAVAVFTSGVSHPVLLLLIRVGGFLAWTLFVIQLAVSFVLLRLDFELRWYVLSDRSLRIREGILSLREKTMTFANVQQISIRQNPLQRALGIADVQVSSAGGGAGHGESGGGSLGESMHEAWFRGVDSAETIRAAIRERVRLHRDAGLGDPDDPQPTLPHGPPAILDAARELRAEVGALRKAMVGDAR